VIAFVQNLGRYRYVLQNFVWRDLRVKYRGTVAGYLWTLLEPLALLATYWFVFVVIARRGGDLYPLVVLLGVLPYNLFSAVVSGGANALVSNAPLIRRVYIPRELFVVSAIASNLIIFFLSLLVAIPFLIYYQVTPTLSFFLFPVGVVLMTLFSTGLGLIAACANAVYRDVSYLITVFLRVIFYGSPVIYSLDMVPEKLRDLYLYNPLAVYLTMIRSGFVPEAAHLGVGHIVVSVVAATVTFAGGLFVFARWERSVVKYL
jgi:ABC-2 type transport system permease protein